MADEKRTGIFTGANGTLLLMALGFLFVASYEAYELKQPISELQTEFIKLKSQVEVQSKQIKSLQEQLSKEKTEREAGKAANKQ